MPKAIFYLLKGNYRGLGQLGAYVRVFCSMASHEVDIKSVPKAVRIKLLMQCAALSTLLGQSHKPYIVPTVYKAHMSYH